jgi:hypothetical protein
MNREELIADIDTGHVKVEGIRATSRETDHSRTHLIHA